MVPLAVLPTVPGVLQKPPTFTVPATVAAGDAGRVSTGVWCLALGDALCATVAAFLLPHPASARTALRAAPVRTSERFMWPPGFRSRSGTEVVLHADDPAPIVEPQLEHVGPVEQRVRPGLEVAQILVQLRRSQ